MKQLTLMDAQVDVLLSDIKAQGIHPIDFFISYTVECLALQIEKVPQKERLAIATRLFLLINEQSQEDLDA